jgi:hypothetical protein
MVFSKTRLFRWREDPDVHHVKVYTLRPADVF